MARTIPALFLMAAVVAAAAPPAAAQDESGVITFESNRHGLTEIYAMRPDGSDKTRLTRNRVRDIAAARSPDGAEIVFARGLQSWELFRMAADGTGAEQLTFTSEDELNAVWAPDGRQIAFERQSRGAFGPNSEIYLLDLDSRQERPVTGASDLAPLSKSTPAWAPDGTRMAYAVRRNGQLDIAVTDLATDETTFVTDTPADEVRPAWSPDSSRLVFSRAADRGASLVVASPDGGQEETLTTGRRDAFAASWSPAGTSIAFSAPGSRDRGAEGEYEILRIDLGTGRVRQLTTSHPGRDVAPHWAPGSPSASARARIAVIPADPPASFCTWAGAAGADVKDGSIFAADVLCGKGGNDRLYGHGGNDTLKAGTGDDRVYGQENSDDLITRGDGPGDLANGGSGSDEAWIDCGDSPVSTAWRCG